MAKQFRPIDKYFEQFEDPTIEDSVFQSNEKNKESEENGGETESLVESLKQAEVQRQEATPTTKEEAIDYYTNPRKAGYRTIRYMDQIREQSNKLKVSSDPNFQPTEDNTYSIQEDVLRNDIFMPGARMVWNSMQKAIDEIQISSLEGRVIGATAEIEALKEAAQKRADNLSKPVEYTEEEQERLTELENDIKEYEQDILENKQELKEDIDILGDYWIQQTEIDKLKNSTSMFPDSWRELADGMGGTMSELSAFVASMILPAAGTAIGAGIATGSLSAAYTGAVTSWSGPGAVFTAGAGATIGFFTGLFGSAYAQYHAREHESYAEMQEAYNSFIEGKKREYRLRNNGKEMPEDELRALEKKARRDVKSVYTQNMALFATDVLEIGSVLIPWSKFAERLNKLSRLKRTGLKAGTVVGGYGLGSVWEGREEGDQFLIKNNFIRGVYDDQDISVMQSLFSSNGFASIFSESVKGIGVNAYNNVFDENFIAGRTNSKEFDAAVASGMMIGGFMGGARTAVGLSTQGINIANDRLRYASEAQEFADQIYDKYINAEQDKASMQWFWERLTKKGGVKNIKKIVKRLQRSFPELYDEMDRKLLARMVGEAEIAYNIATGDTVKDLDTYEQEMLFRSIMALQKKIYNSEQSNSKSKEELDEVIAALPAPKREEDQGLPELQQKKAELAAAEGMLEALEKEKINGISIEELLKQTEEQEPNVRHHIAANQAQIAYLKNKLEGAKTKEGEAIPGLREEYSNMLTEYEKNDGDVIVSDELQEKTNAHSNNLAATHANENSYYSLIGAALDTESKINNAIAVRNHPFFEKYNDLLKKKQEAKEEEEFIPALNQQVKPGDTVEVKTPEGATVRGTYEEETDIDEESGEEITTASVVDDKGNRISIADNTPIRVVQPKSEVETELAETFADNANEKTDKEESSKPGPEENTPEEPVEEPADNPEKEEVPEEEKNSSSTASGQKQSDENNKTEPVGETEEEEEIESELPEEPIGTDTEKSVKGSISVGGNLASIAAIEAGTKLYNVLLRIAAKLTDTFSVEYQINLDPLQYKTTTPGLYKKIQNREKLTVDEIKELRITAKFTNPILSAVAPELYMLNHRGDDKPDSKNSAAIRDKIYKAYLANQIAYGTVRIGFSRGDNMIGKVIYNSKKGDVNSIASLFIADPNKNITAKQRVGVAQSDGNVVQNEDDSIGRLVGVKYNAGQIYAFVYNPFTKKKIGLKLNTRDLSSVEIDLITLLLLEISSKKGNKLVDFGKNLTNRQLLDLLVTTYSMKGISAYGTDKLNTRLVIEKGEVRFDFKDKNTYKVLTLNNQEEFRKWASQSGVLKRKVDLKLLGKSVFEAIIDDTINEITILGKTYKRGVNDDYINDFLTNDNDSDATTHTLSTDVTLDANGSPLQVGAAQIYYDTSVQLKPTSKRGQTKKKKKTKKAEEELKGIEQNKINEVLSNWLNDPLRLEGRRSKGVSAVSIHPKKITITWENTALGDLEFKLETKEERQAWMRYKAALKSGDNKAKRAAEQEIGELVANRILKPTQVAEATIDDVQESTEPEMQNPVEETGKPSQNAEGEVNVEIDNESEVGDIDDINNIELPMEVGSEYTEDSSSKQINEDQARSRLRRILGDSVPVQFQKSLIKIAGKGRYAYGVFRKAMIVLSEQAVNGAEFHEAEHAVEFLWLSDQQLKELNAETAKTYGKATQEEIDAIKEQYKQYNLSDEMAAHIHYAELRAEDYRMYALAGEEMGFTGKTLRWFKKLKYSVEYFANPNKAFTTDLLFARMSSGYYAKKDPIPEKLEKWAKGDGMVSMMMSALSISDQAYDQSIDTLLAYIVALKPENGGVAGVANVTNFTKEIKIVKNVVIALLERFANDQTKTEEQRENIRKLLGTKENEYKDGVLDQLTKDMLSRVKQLNIREKEETERANKDLESATKDAFESSNKENANINTKYLISFLIKKDKEGKVIVNPETGLPVIANSSKIFNELEAKLSNIVNYQTFDKENGTIKTVFAYDRMLAILDNMAEQDPTFERLRDIVKNELSDNERTQFFNTMSKSNNNFLTALQFQSLAEEAGETVVNNTFRFINPQQNSKKYRIMDKWLGLLGDNPLFRTELGENDEVNVYGDAELAKNIVAKFDTVVSDILNLSSNITTLPIENAKKLRDLLKEAGILMSTEGVQAFYQMYYNDSIKKRAEDPSMNSRSKMVGELKFIFGNSTKKGEQKPYTIYSISKGDSKTPLKKVDFVTENYLKQERRVVGRLAEAESVFQEDYDQTTILKTEGRKAWIYSLNNYFKKKSLQYNASTYYANNLLGAVYNKGSILLNYLQREGTSINYRTFNIFQKKGGISSGVEYKDIVEADEYNLRVNMTMNDDIYSPPTMADKGVWLVYQGPKYLSTSQIKNIKYDAETDTYIIPDTILNVFQDYAISELNRIRDAQKQLFGDDEALAWDDKDLVQFYHFMDLLEDGTPDRNSANALKSQLFEGMLTTEFLENLGITKKGRVIKFAVDKLKQNPEFKAAMSKALNERIRKEITKAVEYSVVKQFENGNLAIGSTDITTFSQFLEDSNADMAARHLISGYTLKSMISSIEIMKAFSGDPAYYKSMVEMQKRLPELIAPGQDLNITSPEQETFTAAVLQDITKKSEYYETYLRNFKDFNDKFDLGFTEKQIVEILKPYDKKGINQTDAQGYITLARWKSIMEMLGKWTQTEAKELDTAYERLLEGKGTNEDMKLIAAMPLKGMYFDLREHKGLKVPTYFKYSQAVLFPQLVKGSEELQTLYDTMLEKEVDEVIFESGVKVGAQFPERFTADKQGSVLELKNSMVLRNEYWKLQQDLRPHTSPTQLEGSQIKRNIIANVELDKTYSVIIKTGKKENQYKEVTGRELVQMAHDADIALSNLGKEELLEEFGVKTSEDGLTYKIVDYTKLAAILEKEFLNDTKTTNKLLKSLQLNSDKTGFKIPLSENPFADKIDQKIGALITKRTVKLEMPGGSYIQMSNYGFRRVQRFSSLSKEEQASISRVTNPKPLRPATFNKNKEHVRAQLMLPSYFKDLIPGNEKMSSLEIGEYIKDKNLLRGIAYRIPNQGMSSIDAFDVVGFLPKSMGDTVVAYDDITSKTGSDFDIDKMYIMLPNYGVNKETGEIYYIKSDKKYKDRSMQRKALQNRKLEIYDAIVTDPKTYISLVTPLDSIGTKFRAAKVRLFENINKFSQQEITSLKALESSKEYDKYIKAVNKVLNRLEDLEWFSPSYQLETKQSYIGGKFGVGQVARALVDHAISQFNPIVLNQYLGIGNKRGSATSLADIYNERREIISNIISGRLNAYVDIAKDPYIFYLNNNSLTANTVSLLDRAGVSPEWTDFFMPQPILKKFVAYTRYNQAENTTKKMRNGKMLSAEDLIFDEYRQAFAEAKMSEGIDGATIQDYYKEFNGILAGLKEKYKKGLPDLRELFSEEQLIGMLRNGGNMANPGHVINQIKVYLIFNKLKGIASAVNDVVSASKQDVEGSGGGSANVIASINKKNKAILNDTVLGVDARFNNTMLDAYTQNSVKLMQELFREQFDLFTPGYQAALAKLYTYIIDESIATDPFKIRKAYTSLKAVYLGSKIEGFTQDKLKELLAGNNNIFKRLAYYQLSKESPIQNNELVNSLILNRASSVAEMNSIQFRSGLMDGKDQDRLEAAWEDLLVHENAKVRKFAADLALYAYATSGMTQRMFSFHHLIPFDYENIMFQRNVPEAYTKYNGDIAAEYQERTDSFSILPFVEPMIRNFSDTHEYAPTVSASTITNKRIDKNTKKIIAFATGDLKVRKEIIEDNSKYEEFSKFVKLGDDLYELVGFSTINEGKVSNPVYAKTNKLGYNEKGNIIIEPFITDTSIFRKNRVETFTKEDQDGKTVKKYKAISLDTIIDGITFKEGANEKNRFLTNPREFDTSGYNYDTNEIEGNEELYHLENTLAEQAREYARLSNKLLGLSTIYTGDKLSTNTKNTLKRLGLSEDEIESFEGYLESNFEAFRGKRLDVLAAFRYDSFMKANKESLKEIELLTQAANKELDKYLIEYLEEFGVKITERTIEEMAQRYGIGRLGVTNSLKKIIEVAQDRNAALMPEEFSHMLIDLVGVDNEVIKPLMDNITSWGKYPQVVEDYRNDPAYQLSDGSINFAKIQKEAAGKLLAEAIVYANRKAEPKGFFLKTAYGVYNAILDILQGIKFVMGLSEQPFLLKGSKKEIGSPIEAIANDIANKVLEGEKAWMENYREAREEQFKSRSYEESLADYPKAAKLLEEIIVKLKARLVGSLAIRAQGILMRPDSETVHDLDFEISKKDLEVKTRQDVWDWINNVVTKEIENFIPLYVWDKNSSGKFIVNGIVTEYPYIAKKFRDLRGNFVSRMKQLSQFERDNVILIDFFLNSEDRDATKEGFAKWQDIFEAKVGSEKGFKRDKDYYDMRRFIPYEEYADTDIEMDSEFTYYNISRAEIVKRAKEEIDKAAKDGAFRKWGGVYYQWNNPSKRVNMSLEAVLNINNKVFNGGKVVRLVQTPNGKIGQKKVAVFPNNYIDPQLDLFDNPYKPKCD